MAPAGLFIDTHLLVLLVVGSCGRELIAKHKRLRAYTADDYDLLIDLIKVKRVDRVFVTPNTLTETSNLLAQHAEPERSRLLDRLGGLIRDSGEVFVTSAQASSNVAFLRLGLTDAAILEAISAESPLLTADLDLYLAALGKGGYLAENFTHFRDL